MGISEHRRAYVVGSGASISDSIPTIKREIVKNNVDSFADLLATQDIGFDVETTTRPTRLSLIHYLARLKEFGKPKDGKAKEYTFFFYFFGHGFIGSDGSLDLAFQDEAMKFDEILTECTRANVKRAIFMLDCCHAGLAVPQIAAKFPRQGEYALVASTGTGWSRFEVTGGKFTRALIAVMGRTHMKEIRDKKHTDSVTIESWVDAAKTLLEEDDGEPQTEGELLNFPVRSLELSVTPMFNNAAPDKSLYTKYFKILEWLGEKHTTDALLAAVKAAKDRSFQLPSIGRGPARYVTPARMTAYLEELARFGLAEERSDDKWYPTKAGDDGANFRAYNRVLVDVILKFLKRSQVERSAINDAILELLGENAIPNTLNIERVLLQRGITGPTRSLLKACMTLLSFAGVYQRASWDTFFP